jgi:hypothetical protein
LVKSQLDVRIAQIGVATSREPALASRNVQIVAQYKFEEDALFHRYKERALSIMDDRSEKGDR